MTPQPVFPPAPRRGSWPGAFATNTPAWLMAGLFNLAYLLMLTEPTAAAQRSLLITVGAAFVALGVFGFAPVARAASGWVSFAYLAVQFFLGALLANAGGTGIGSTLLMLLLVSQGTRLLPLPWALLLCALLPVLHLGMDWAEWLRTGVGLVVAGVFVVLITRVAATEQRRREEQEQLAQQLRAFAQQSEELAIARERNRLARDIHDGLGHHLTVLHIQLQAARAVLRADPDKAELALSTAASVTRDALADVRHSVSALRVMNGTLLDALAALAHDADPRVHFQLLGAPRPLPAAVEHALYRAAQEGLTNARKYACARRVELTLTYHASHVNLQIADDGVGAEGVNGGHGLPGLRERFAPLGGEVRIQTAPGQGFSLLVGVPA